MTTFILKPTQAAEGQEPRTISIPGSKTYTFPQVYVDFEYNRRAGGNLLEVATHHYEDLDQVKINQPINVTVPTLQVFIQRTETGIVISSSNLQEKIILPGVDFSTDDTFIKTQLMNIYQLLGYSTEDVMQQEPKK